MELRVLRYFLAVAREKSISKAAEYLHLTQPTLSRQMMDLEIELGKRLFVRGNRKITLTEEGIFLCKRANEIIELVEKVQLEFQNTGVDVSDNVYIGVGESNAMRLIARAAKTLHNTHPHSRFHLFSGNADEVGERLQKGLLDFGVLVDPGDLEKYDYIELPAANVWGVLMRKDSPLARLERVRPEDLWEKPLLLSRQDIRKDCLSNWFRRDYATLNIVATYNRIFNATLMVDEGLGYAVGLGKLINTIGDSNLCFRPLEPKLEAKLYVVWKKFQVFSKAPERFLAILQGQTTNAPELHS